MSGVHTIILMGPCFQVPIIPTTHYYDDPLIPQLIILTDHNTLFVITPYYINIICDSVWTLYCFTELFLERLQEYSVKYGSSSTNNLYFVVLLSYQNM